MSNLFSLASLTDIITDEDMKPFIDLGKEIGQLYTSYGFPLDISLERLKMNKKEKVAVIHGASCWFIEHKRNSGATEKSLEKQRRTNNDMITRFVSTGETGIY